MDQRTAVQNAQIQEERLKNLSREETSILKAQNYLTDSITLVAAPERIFLTYLQRKFNLPDILGADGPPIDLNENPQAPADLRYLARIAYPDRIEKSPPPSELDDGLQITNIYSANCDHMPLPDNFWQTIEKNVAAGGYPMTHVALAFAFMKDNSCPLPPNAGEIKNAVVQGMEKLASDSETPADLRYEAVAFLLLTGRKDLVQSTHIDKIISEQREDGGWSTELGGRKSEAHPTILATWALLEYSRPATPAEPLIKQPATP